MPLSPSLLGSLPLSFYSCLYRFSSISLLLPDCWARNESNNRASSRLVAGPKLPSTTASSLLTLRLHPFAASASKAKSSQTKPNQNQRNATQLHTNPPPANLPTHLPQAASTTILTSTTYVRHQNNKAPAAVSRYRLVLHLATPTLTSTPTVTDTDTDTDSTFSASLPPRSLTVVARNRPPIKLYYSRPLAFRSDRVELLLRSL